MFKVGDIVTPVKDHGPLKQGLLYKVVRAFEDMGVDYVDVKPLEGGAHRGGYLPSRFHLHQDEHDDLYI